MTSAPTFVQLGGLQFHYEVSGRSDAPWLVFSNSLMTSLAMWDAQCRAFGDSYRILRYDQRGHGQTQPPVGASTFDELSDDLEAICAHLQIERAVVIGISMGGVTALRLAQRFPARVAGVVACDCQWFSPATSITVWEERISIANESGMAGLLPSTIPRWFRPAFINRNGPGLDDVRRMIAGTSLAGFVSCARALQSFDIRPEFPRIQAPTCFVVGDGDGVLPTVMRDMHRGLTGSTFAQIAEAGHLPNIEQPATVNHTIQAFLIQIGWNPRP
jgi:3-oxoadipate enol-lactonase